MTRRARKPLGLAAQILRVTVTIGVLTVLSASVVAMVGTSRMVTEQIATRDAAALQAIEDAIQSRFADAQTVSGRVTAAVVQARGAQSLRTSLAPVLQEATGTASSVRVLDGQLGPIASIPSSLAALPPEASRTARIALSGIPGMVRSSETTGLSSLWLAQPVRDAADRPLVVVIEMDLAFVSELLQHDARQWRSVYLLEDGSVIASAAQEPIDFTKAHVEPDAPHSGRLEVTSASGTRYSGYFNDIEGMPALNWRFVVLERSGVVRSETLLALWPSILVLTVGGVVAVFGAWLMARRVVAPLKQLESAALRAARGAYVKPIESTRDDELGLVAAAFNAVALRLNALHDLSQLLASSSQLDQVLDGILSAMGHIVGPGTAVIYLLDDAGHWLVPVRARGADISNAPAIDATGDTWLARALKESGPSEYEPGDTSLAEELPGLAFDGHAALVAPLVAGNEALGVVVVRASAGASATEAELEMVRTFSAQAAVAVQNSRLFSVESESRRVAEGLQSLAERLVRPGALSTASAEVQAMIAQLFNARRARLAIVDRFQLGLGPAPDTAEEAAVVSAGLRAVERAGGHAAVVVLGDDAEADALMARLGVTKMIVAPVALDTAHGAVLAVCFEEGEIGRRELELAETVANEVAITLDNAYLYERALARATSLETVFEISQAVGSSLEVKVVLDRVLDVVQKLLFADAVALMTYDPRKRVIATEMARGALSPAMIERVYRPDEDVVGFAFTSGEPVAYRELRADLGGIAGDAALHGLTSMLAVPLLARGRSIGVLTVFSATEGAFSDEETSLLQTFASQASLAIDTARLYSREHDVATILQHSILPGALPQFDGIDAASAYEPAEGDAEIGGDYYDLFHAPDGSIWLAIGDVCGKGVVAATKTSMIKYSVRSLVVAGFLPGPVLSEVNRMIAESGDPSDIVTLWLGRIAADRALLTWASGGHPPGLVRRAVDGTVDRLPANGPLLGAVSGVTYTNETTALSEGDAILLYTDGVTEARSGNTFFGEARVEAAFVNGGSAAEVVESVRSSVRAFVQAALRDDVAILAVRLTGRSRDGE